MNSINPALAKPFDPLTAWGEDIARIQEQQEAVQDELKARQEQSRIKATHRMASGTHDVMSAYKAAYDIPSALQTYGYIKNGKGWLSPNSESGNPGVSISNDGRKWFSHHSSDAGIGETKNGCQWGDAWDLFKFHEHGNNDGAALAAAGEMFTTDSGETINQANRREFMQNKSREITEEVFDFAEPDPFKGFPPLTREQTTFESFEEPDPPDAIISYRDECCLEKPVVGGIFGSGGTGKGFFTLELGVALAEGKGLGPLKAADDEGHEVLMIAAEDGLNIVKRRLWDISEQTGKLPSKFHIASTVGKVGPIMVLNNGTAQTTIWYEWLKETIKNHMPLDLLILDPKSRLSALPENDNTNGTSFIHCLERLSQEFNISILFCHHTPKATKSLDQNMSRGGGSYVDGCRWALGMMTLNDVSAKQYGVTKHSHDYVEMDLVKTNYGPGFKSKLLFKRDENGVLHFDNTQAVKREKTIDTLYDAIGQHDGVFSKNDIQKKLKGADVIYTTMEINECSVTAKYCLKLINQMIARNLLIEEEIGTGSKPKKVIKCVDKDVWGFNQTSF